MRVLHLSDLHFSETTRWDAEDVLGTLIEDARAQARDGVYLVVVTGDVANFGLAAEYALAKTWLDELLAAVGVGPERVVLVRGNHDVERGKFGPAGKALVNALYQASEADQNAMLEDPEARALLLRPARAWLAFAAAYGGDPDRTWGPRSFEVRGKRVHVAVIDSGLPCFDDAGNTREPPGPMVAAAMAGHRDADLVLVATHHPVPEGAAATARVRQAHAVLRGHLHEHDPRLEKRPDGEGFVLPAGSSYAGSTWANAYAILEFAAVGVTIAPRVWDRRALRWGAGPTWHVPWSKPELADHDPLCAAVRLAASELSWLTEELGRQVDPTDTLVQLLDARGHHATLPLRDLIDRPNASSRRWWRLEGDPGAGKSTLLKRLALDLLGEGAG
jgi:predicted phosphodiesterase